MQVQSVIDGVILGETDASQGFWQTLLAGGKNVFNLGGNIETTTLGAPPLLITIDGIICELKEVGNHSQSAERASLCVHPELLPGCNQRSPIKAQQHMIMIWSAQATILCPPWFPKSPHYLHWQASLFDKFEVLMSLPLQSSRCCCARQCRLQWHAK